MLKSLKKKIVEAERPVGVKTISNWKLPPSEFAYGKKEKDDEFHAGIITNSWVNHVESVPRNPPPQDFVKINKLAVKHRAVDFKSTIDFRKNVDIKQEIKKGSKYKKIYLPNEDFVYGKRNRTPTPVKEVVNFEYGNKGKANIQSNYNKFIQSNLNKQKLLPKVTKNFIDRLDKLNEEKYGYVEEKKPYKMKMFSNVQPKVTKYINKNYHNNNKNNYNFHNNNYNEDENIDNLISKVENDIKDLNNT